MVNLYRGKTETGKTVNVINSELSSVITSLDNLNNTIIAKKIEDKELEKLLYKELDKLKERDKLIMILRYGLYNSLEYTQKEVAEKLGISQSYISRIEKKVIKRLSQIIKN